MRQRVNHQIKTTGKKWSFHSRARPCDDGIHYGSRRRIRVLLGSTGLLLEETLSNSLFHDDIHQLTAVSSTQLSQFTSPTHTTVLIIQTDSSSRSSKVINLGANQKRICNFLLVTLDVSPIVFEILTHLARKYMFSPPHPCVTPLAEEDHAISM